MFSTRTLSCYLLAYMISFTKKILLKLYKKLNKT